MLTAPMKVSPPTLTGRDVATNCICYPLPPNTEPQRTAKPQLQIEILHASGVSGSAGCSADLGWSHSHI